MMMWLGWQLLEQGALSPPDQQWKTAFALGFLCHLAGDTIAQVILTPHLAWYSEDAGWKIREDIVEDIDRALRGRPPRWCVNEEVLSREDT